MAHFPHFSFPHIPHFLPWHRHHQPVVFTYFPIRGLANAIRLMLAAAGVSFIETLPETKEAWLALKESLPYGQVPLLEMDGHRLVQSRAILNYLAHKYNFAGHGPAEHYYVDSLCESHRDVFSGLPGRDIAFSQGNISDELQEKINAWVAGPLAKGLAAWEKILSNRPGPFFLGHRPSTADFLVYETLSWLPELNVGDVLADKPLLAGLAAAMKTHPRIAAFENGPQARPLFLTGEAFEKVMSLM